MVVSYVGSIKHIGTLNINKKYTLGQEFNDNSSKYSLGLKDEVHSFPPSLWRGDVSEEQQVQPQPRPDQELERERQPDREHDGKDGLDGLSMR